MGNRQQAKPMTWGEKLARENRDLKEKIGMLKIETATLQRNLRNTWQLMEALPGAVILVEKRQIVFANEAACEVLGYEKQELLERHMTDLVHPDSDIFLENLSAKISPAEGMHDPHEVVFLKKNGGRLLCAVGMRSIRRDRKKAFLVNMLEIEQIKEKERRAGASQNMENMQRVITIFDKQMEAFMLLFEKPPEGLKKVKRGTKTIRYCLKR